MVGLATWLLFLNCLSLKASLVTVFLLLWPQDVLDDNCSDHGDEHRDPDDNEEACHHTADNPDRPIVERLGDREGRGNQCYQASISDNAGCSQS